MPQADNDFLKFLENTPEFLAKFIDIIHEWYKLQGEVPQPSGEEPGPRKWAAGEKHALATVGLTLGDLEAITKGYAEAVVKEKAIEYIKGFISGVMLAAGA